MTADAILSDLLANGITPELTHDETGIEVPAGRLTPEQRQAIRNHKPELIEAIREASRITSELLTAAMRACDHYGDSPAAREQMRADCLATRPELGAQLLAHFNRTYGGER